MSKGGLAMSTERSPHNNKQEVTSTVDDVMSNEAFELSPQLLAEFDDDESPSDEVLRLLEENARLRALAVELSNLLGNLPNREWSAALTSAAPATRDRPKAGA
jgi:hypothetical protein